jgi:hypothetical protein
LTRHAPYAWVVSIGHRNEDGCVIDRWWHGREEAGSDVVVDAG